MRMTAKTVLYMEIPDDTSVGTEYLVDAVIRLVVTELSAETIDVTDFVVREKQMLLGAVRASAVGQAVKVVDHVDADGEASAPRATLERSD